MLDLHVNTFDSIDNQVLPSTTSTSSSDNGGSTQYEQHSVSSSIRDYRFASPPQGVTCVKVTDEDNV